MKAKTALDLVLGSMPQIEEKAPTLEDQIREFLFESSIAYTPLEIATLLKINVNTVRGILGRLLHKGHAIQPGRTDLMISELDETGTINNGFLKAKVTAYTVTQDNMKQYIKDRTHN